jgi:hypothetical protein
MKTKASIFFLVFSLILGACAPAGTPAGGPDLSGKVGPLIAAKIVSAKASPASFAYSYKCGTTSIPPIDITFTVQVDNFEKIAPDDLSVLLVWALEVSGGSVPADGEFNLTLTGTAGTVMTFTGSTEASGQDLGSKIMPAEGASGDFRWFAIVLYGPKGTERPLDSTDVFLIPFAACKAPPVDTVVPPHIDLTVVAPGSSDKPKQGGGGSPPSCSVDPNDPNCIPGP